MTVIKIGDLKLESSDIRRGRVWIDFLGYPSFSNFIRIDSDGFELAQVYNSSTINMQIIGVDMI